MSQVVTLRKSTLHLEERWLHQLNIGESSEVLVDLEDDALMVRPLRREDQFDKATERLIEILSQPVGRFADQGEISQEGGDFDWNGEDIED